MGHTRQSNALNPKTFMAPRVMQKEQITPEHHFELPLCLEYYFCTPLKYTLSEEEVESPLSDYIFTSKTLFMFKTHHKAKNSVSLDIFSSCSLKKVFHSPLTQCQMLYANKFKHPFPTSLGRRNCQIVLLY